MSQPVSQSAAKKSENLKQIEEDLLRIYRTMQRLLSNPVADLENARCFYALMEDHEIQMNALQNSLSELKVQIQTKGMSPEIDLNLNSLLDLVDFTQNPVFQKSLADLYQLFESLSVAPEESQELRQLRLKAERLKYLIQ